MFKTALDYYEDFLGSSTYLAGNVRSSAPFAIRTTLPGGKPLLTVKQHLSLGDVYVFTWMPYIKLLGLYEEVAAGPNVEDLWKRVSSRSAWKSAVKDMPQ